MEKNDALHYLWVKNTMNPNQFMHQKQIVVFRDHMYVVDGFRTFRGHPGQHWANFGWSWKTLTIHCTCLVLEDLSRPSEIWFLCMNWFGIGVFQAQHIILFFLRSVLFPVETIKILQLFFSAIITGALSRETTRVTNQTPTISQALPTNLVVAVLISLGKIYTPGPTSET